MLDVLGCLVAKAHRSHTAIAGQGVGKAFGQIMLQRDAIDRLDMPALGVGDRIAKIGEIVFQRPDG